MHIYVSLFFRKKMNFVNDVVELLTAIRPDADVSLLRQICPELEKIICTEYHPMLHDALGAIVRHQVDPTRDEKLSPEWCNFVDQMKAFGSNTSAKCISRISRCFKAPYTPLIENAFGELARKELNMQ